jgi:hypothetical protein
MAVGPSVSRSEVDVASIAIARLEKQLVGKTGNAREAILAEITKNQEIIDNARKKKRKKSTTESDAKISKQIAEEQALLDSAIARNEVTSDPEDKVDTTAMEQRIKDLNKELSTATPTSASTFDTSTTDSGTPKPSVTPTPTPKPATGGKGKAPSPTADPKTAWIGYLQATFKTLPLEFKNEIDKIFEQALRPNSGWTQDTFNEAIKQTKWYQTTYPSVRQFFIESNDPRNAANFAEKLQNQTDSISAKLEQLGVRAQQLDPVSGKYYSNTQTIQGIAMASIQNNWNDVQLTQHLGDNAQLLFTGGGAIGSSVEKIKSAALLYGINIDNKYLNKIQTSLLDPSDGRDTQWYLNEMQNQAIDLYKPFAESIKSGRTLYEITNNYRTKMSNLLEVDSENITWQDLMGKVIDPTTGNARMESEFTKQLKQDPLWQYTKNAKETYSNMSLDLMKQFGFMG